MTVASMDELDDIRIGHEKGGCYIHDRFGAVRQEAGYIVPPDKQDELDNYLQSSIVASFSVEALRAAPGISDSPTATPTELVCAETRDLSEYNEALTEADLKRLKAILEHEVTDNTKINYRAQWRRFGVLAYSVTRPTARSRRDVFAVRESCCIAILAPGGRLYGLMRFAK